MWSVYRVTLLSIVIWITGCAEIQTKHPDITQHLQKIDTVVIAPPTVLVEYLTFTGENEALTDIEVVIRDQLMKQATEQLIARNYQVVFYDFNAALEADEEFAYTLTELREGFAQAKSDFVKGKMLTGEEKRFRENMARSANVITGQAGADAILLLTYNGYRKSDGLIAKDMATSVILAALTGSVAVTPNEGAGLEVALVDGHTGDILYTNTAFAPTLSGVEVLGKSLVELPHDVKGGSVSPSPDSSGGGDSTPLDSDIDQIANKTRNAADSHSGERDAGQSQTQ